MCVCVLCEGCGGLETDAELKGVLGDQRLACVQRRDQLSRLVARRQILLKMLVLGSPSVCQGQIVDVPVPLVQEEFVESEALEGLSAEEVIVDISQERVSQRTVEQYCV